MLLTTVVYKKITIGSSHQTQRLIQSFQAMRFLITFATLVAIVVSIPIADDDGANSGMEHMKFFLYEDENGEIQVEHLVNVEVNLTASATDVTYHYYSQKNPTTSKQIHSNDINALKSTAFSASKDTLFIIHGWKNTHASDVNSHIRENILRGHDVNVFVVDWSPIAGKNYISAQLSMNKVGQYIADFISSLEKQYNLQLGRVKFVGHSLGAQISGCAGASLKDRIDRIVGLDPAGPLFSEKKTSNRLDPTDAKFVQAIHTNDGKLGLNVSMGHTDYYPNGGKKQPGCGLDLTGSCAHSRAYNYYAESLNSNKFVARRCGGWSEYSAGLCSHGDSSSMGMFEVDTKAKGKYYLATKKSSPFAEG